MPQNSKELSDQTHSEVKKLSKLDHLFLEVYKVFQFLARFFKEAFRPPYEWQELIRQCYQVGVKSLLLISLTGLIVGIIFTKQSRPSLSEFGATSWLPSLISIAINRTLAPLLTALIAAGKVGSSIGAELSSMKVSEQIDAMEVSGTRPFKYLVCIRILATTLMMPLLSAYTALIALLGGFLNIYTNEGTSWNTFIEQVFEPISFVDLISSLSKAVLFGFTIGAVSCYQGYNATKGTEGVGKAANASVVTGMFMVFIEEILVVQITGFFK